VSTHHFLLARWVTHATVVLDVKTGHEFSNRLAAARRAAMGVSAVVTVSTPCQPRMPSRLKRRWAMPAAPGLGPKADPTLFPLYPISKFVLNLKKSFNFQNS
jgi:hypothetical protein